MKERFSFLIKIYIWFLSIFVILKPLFILYHHESYGEASFGDWIDIVKSGFSMDISVSSYLIAPLILTTLISFFVTGKWIKFVSRTWLLTASVVAAVVAITDLALYSYWGFRIDATPIFYLANPTDALASAETWELIVFPLLMVVAVCTIYYPTHRVTSGCDKWEKQHVLTGTILTLLIAGIDFVGIRGGLGTSTMSVGRAYYSTNIKYNHAAVNPLFSLLHSLTHQDNFGSYARFMDDEEATDIFNSLFPQKTYIPTDDECWLKNRRPNVLIIILEGFSKGALINNGEIVAPNLVKLSQEGISFENLYANSFRTDRGIFSIIDGFPALPTTSVMKYADKMVTFPSLVDAIKEHGYNTSFLYGGDANFTNMRSFFATGGVDEFVTDKELNISSLESKWGADDEVTFNYLKSDILAYNGNKPFLKVFLTLSSHEPFEVPLKKLENPYLNTVAFTDSCLGNFIDTIKLKPDIWNNTLVVLLPDHGVSYLLGYEKRAKESFAIPMVWTGGAIKGRRVIDKCASQSDMVATLLSQMGIGYSDFRYSRNIADSTMQNFAYWTFPNGFAMLKENSYVVYDCDANSATTLEGENADETLLQGKAILQKLYDRIK